MERVDCIIYGDYLITMNEQFEIFRDGGIAIKDRKILFVGSSEDLRKQYYSEITIDGKGKAVLPGLINTHTHAAMVYFRGLSDDIPLKEWLEQHIWPAENRWLSKEFVYDATGLACLEMLKAGITTYHDMYFFSDETAKKTKEMGMRAVLGVGILDFQSASAKTTDEYLKNAYEFVNRWRGDSLITPSIAPHAIYTCSTETLKKAKELSEKLQVNVHIHLSETQWEVNYIRALYNKYPVEYLDSIGFLDNTVTAAHCVWLEDKEIDILAKRKVGVSHCMESNLKLASGFAPVVTMLNSGVKVTFGTDGAASNNDLNIFSEMATTAKVHKALANNPTVLDAKTILLMATRWGADVLGLGDKLGSIEKGKLADIITLNLKKPHLMPIYNIYSQIVYSALASDVVDVLVDGKVVIRNGQHIFCSEEEVLDKALQWSYKIGQFDKKL
ncbi:MAG: amidohydrolase [Thermodesulfovibrionales bacterium]|nr:amidohydrolase [Thermodesulfovibrionales bacterium]